MLHYSIQKQELAKFSFCKKFKIKTFLIVQKHYGVPGGEGRGFALLHH